MLRAGRDWRIYCRCCNVFFFLDVGRLSLTRKLPDCSSEAASLSVVVACLGFYYDMNIWD